MIKKILRTFLLGFFIGAAAIPSSIFAAEVPVEFLNFLQGHWIRNLCAVTARNVLLNQYFILTNGRIPFIRNNKFLETAMENDQAFAIEVEAFLSELTTYADRLPSKSKFEKEVALEITWFNQRILEKREKNRHMQAVP